MDNPQLLPLVDGYFRTEQSGAGARDVRLLAEKPYAQPCTRTVLRPSWDLAHDPRACDQIARRKPRACCGRLPAFEASIYKQRNSSSALQPAKHWRG